MSTRTKSASGSLSRLDLPEDRIRLLYRRLWTSRLIDERGRKLFRQGRMLGNMYTAAGQEAITLVPAFLLKELDFIGPSHRELPASVGKGVPLKAIFAQILARAVSPDKGKSHPCHYGYAPLRVLTPASTVAAQYVVATGVALAYKMQKNGLVAIAFTGDGGTARGDFHEALNFAAVHKVPAVYFIQNNLWAESVPLSLQTALTDLSDRAKAYGMPGITIDGNDVLEVYETASKAIARDAASSRWRTARSISAWPRSTAICRRRRSPGSARRSRARTKSCDRNWGPDMAPNPPLLDISRHFTHS